MCLGHLQITQPTTRVVSWPCSLLPPSGLDSAATLAIARSLKLAARAMNSTIVMSLLQPEPEVFDTFDHVILLAEGKASGRCTSPGGCAAAARCMLPRV